MQVYIPVVGFGPNLELPFCDLDIQAVDKRSLISIIVNEPKIFLFFLL